MPTFLFYLVCLLFSFGQLGRVSFYNQQVNFYVYEIFLLPLLFFLIIKLKTKPLKYFYQKAPIVFYFLGWLVVSYLLNFFNYRWQENLIAFLYLIRLLFYWGFCGYLGYWGKENPDFKKVLQRGIIIIIVITIITGIAQYFLYPDLRNLYYAGWDPHLSRMFGLFFDTSIAASVYGLMLLYLFITKKYPWLQFLILICLMLTFSRSVIITTIIFIMIITLKKYHFKKTLLLFGLLIIIFVLIPKKFGVGVGLNRIFSIEARINDYKQAISLWKKSPLIGFGYNRIPYLKEKYNLANIKDSLPQHALASFSSSYLIVLVSSGIIGLIGLMSLMGVIWKEAKTARALMVFLGTVSLFDNVLLHPFILFLAGVLSILFDKKQ